MNTLRCVLHLACIALLGISLSATAATALTAQDLARCAGIAAADARLACYDMLAGRAPDRAGPAVAATPPPPVAATTAPDKSAAPATASTPAAAIAPSAPPAVDDPRNFGLTQTQQHVAPVGPANLQARIAKIVDNRAGRAYVVLDNGQTWTLTDQDEGARLGAGDLVTIKRASLGSFLMLTPSRRSYHVRRTQ